MSNIKVMLAIIIILSAVLRLVALDKFPNGFTGDEAQQGYSAYSIFKTGKDEWGELLPLFPRGFGDYKPPLYTYLTVPSVGLLGLNVLAVRLPAALAGILAVLIVYFLTKELLKNQKIALWASFLLAINPWHIQISRTAWEGGLGILTFSLGLLFFLKSGLRNLLFAAFFWGLTLYSYHSWRFFLISFTVTLVIMQWKKFMNWKSFMPALVLFIFMLPILLNLSSVLSRSSDVGIFSQTELVGYFTNKGGSPLPPLLDRLMDNKYIFVISNFFGNYISYFSPSFFFSSNRPDNTYLNFPYFPLLFPIEIIFWLAAVYFLLNKRQDYTKILIFWFVLSLIPAALAVGSMNANRTPTLLPLISIISAIGLVYIIERWKNAKVILLILGGSFIFFLHFYFISLPKKAPDNLRYGYDKVFSEVLRIESDYSEIVISKAFSEPQIFLAFYGKIDPNEFQMASKDWLRYEAANKKYVDQLESYNLGKFLFEDVNWNMKDSKRETALIVSKEQDFPKEVPSLVDIFNLRGKILYRLVPVKNEEI